ncbi:hypothetical protein Leryth_026894 [Lithospermum erythrorhizon]|nr:hypothetical protein Leryth_026894 [Lithospermum erythrorhizon]
MYASIVEDREFLDVKTLNYRYNCQSRSPIIQNLVPSSDIRMLQNYLLNVTVTCFLFKELFVFWFFCYGTNSGSSMKIYRKKLKHWPYRKT